MVAVVWQAPGKVTRNMWAQVSNAAGKNIRSSGRLALALCFMSLRASNYKGVFVWCSSLILPGDTAKELGASAKD